MSSIERECVEMKSFMPLLEQNAFQNAIAQSFFLKQYLHYVSKTTNED